MINGPEHDDDDKADGVPFDHENWAQRGHDIDLSNDEDFPDSEA